ncbi:MAG: serine dehydrogenasease [Armatimonadetes bacterium]|nr:serine dehydrogenasease [Armatimonadota bacterium]
MSEIEDHFDADAIFYLGQIAHPLIKLFRDQIEKLRLITSPRSRLVIILGTPGGSAEVVEKLVDIIRYYYDQVYFVVPDEAMSAGTIFCMSGDKIYMDYTSSLGPIDPQIWNGKQFVPARGYLDEIENMLEKAKNGTITNAELLIWQSQDLAMLNQCEQQSNLTVTLLKKWLVEYKFSDWQTHGTTTAKIGQPVTMEEKEERAEEIAVELGNNKKWHSHGRRIGIETLTKDLKLKIEDYSDNADLRKMIRSYNDLLTEYIQERGFPAFFHSRHYF